MSASRRRVLLTAFEPFGGDTLNASAEVARLLSDGDGDGGPEVLLLPVVAGAAEAALLARLDAGPAPMVIVSLGEADDAPVVRLEKVAVNWDDFRIPDNAGNQPRDAAIRAGGPAAYFAPVPVARIAEHLAGQTPLPVVVSLTAGAFVCNHLAYTVLDALSSRPDAPPFLFVHVPRWRPDEDLVLEEIAEAVRAVVDAL